MTLENWGLGLYNCKQHPYNLDDSLGVYSALNLVLLRMSTKSIQCLEVLKHSVEISGIFCHLDFT